ncbi:MAG TPA: peptidoglycan-binding domain-containing protein [Gammaproteobacteria bacterium]
MPAPAYDQAIVRDIQTMLNELGYNAGQPDGIYGPGTRNAIQTFQHDRGLPVDGKPDYNTAMSLRIALEAGHRVKAAPSAQAHAFGNTSSRTNESYAQANAMSGKSSAGPSILRGPNGQVLRPEGIPRFGRTIATNAGRLSVCDRERAGQFRERYRAQVRRLQAEKESKTMSAYDQAFAQSSRGRLRCTEQITTAYDQRAAQALAFLNDTQLVTLGTSSPAPRTGTVIGAEPAPVESRSRSPAAGVASDTHPISDDDPKAPFVVDAEGKVLSVHKVLGMGSDLACSSGHLIQCKPGTAAGYEEQFLAHVARLYPAHTVAAKSEYDSQFELCARFPLDCDDRRLDVAEKKVNGILVSLGKSSVMERQAARKRAAARLAAEGGIGANPAIEARISGSLDEIERLGSGLQALEAGVVWYRKYERIFQPTAGTESENHLRRFMVRREKDVTAQETELSAMVDAARSGKEIDTLVRRYLIVPGPRGHTEQRIVGRAVKRKKELKQAEELAAAQVTRQERKKAIDTAGSIGEPELIEAYINTRMRTIHLQRKVSDNSVATLHPLTGASVDTTTVESAQVHSCNRVDRLTYRCLFSMQIHYEPAPELKNNILLRPLYEKMANQLIDRQEDDFVLDQNGWYSPTMAKRISDGLNQPVHVQKGPYDDDPCVQAGIASVTCLELVK